MLLENGLQLEKYMIGRGKNTMKYIIDIDSQSARYTCNVWSVFKYEDGSLSQDCREFASDDKDEFIKFISELKVIPYIPSSLSYIPKTEG